MGNSCSTSQYRISQGSQIDLDEYSNTKPTPQTIKSCSDDASKSQKKQIETQAHRLSPNKPHFQQESQPLIDYNEQDEFPQQLSIPQQQPDTLKSPQERKRKKQFDQVLKERYMELVKHQQQTSPMRKKKKTKKKKELKAVQQFSYLLLYNTKKASQSVDNFSPSKIFRHSFQQIESPSHKGILKNQKHSTSIDSIDIGSNKQKKQVHFKLKNKKQK